MTVSKPIKILAVDDTPDNLFLLEAVLSEVEYYHLCCADSGQAALETIEASPPDLILLDVMMPDMDGYEVTRRIRQNPDLPYIPILLITAHEGTSAAKALKAGANGFIRKPFDIEKLLNRVHSLLQQSRQS
ncbi:MAG: response regulator [Cyanobacteria bacterium P01_G01_bin.38]